MIWLRMTSQISALVLLFACTKQGDTVSTEPTEFDSPKVYFTVQTTTAFTQPTSELRLEDPTTGRLVSNVVGDTLRGTRIDVTKIQDGFAYGQWDLGARGWMPLLNLIPGEAGMLVTTAKPLAKRDTEDAKPSGEIPSGTLLILLEQRGANSLVNYNGQRAAWVKSADLLSDRDDIGAARLLQRMRYSIDNGDAFGPHYGFLRKAQEAYPESQIFGQIELEADDYANRLSALAATRPQNEVPPPQAPPKPNKPGR